MVTNGMKDKIKVFAKKMYNIIPPSIIFIGTGLIAFGVSIIDIQAMNNFDATTLVRAQMLTGMATMWIVYLLGIAIHLTLWTDIEEDEG